MKMFMDVVSFEQGGSESDCKRDSIGSPVGHSRSDEGTSQS